MDPRLDAFLAFREGEQVYHSDEECIECHEIIPDEDDVIEVSDNGVVEGRICEACARKDEESNQT